MSEILTKQGRIIERLPRSNNHRFDPVLWPCDGHECPSCIRSVHHRTQNLTQLQRLLKSKRSSFLDTNILVYAFDLSDPPKQQIAKQLIAEAATAGTYRLSTQVLGQFFHATVIRRRLLTAAEAARAIDVFQAAFLIAAIAPASVTEAIAVYNATSFATGTS